MLVRGWLPLAAQTNTGRILGTVADQSGSAVSGATVTITDGPRGTTRTLTTDDAGAYVAPNLIPSTYQVRTESKGFKVRERPNITVEVRTDVRVDGVLQPGVVTETVVVQEDIPLVSTTHCT